MSPLAVETNCPGSDSPRKVTMKIDALLNDLGAFVGGGGGGDEAIARVMMVKPLNSAAEKNSKEGWRYVAA